LSEGDFLRSPQLRQTPKLDYKECHELQSS
jgi:hypothetical protein